MYARGVPRTLTAATTTATAARAASVGRRRSATGPGRERGLTAIREQGQAVADYWKTLKARNR